MIRTEAELQSVGRRRFAGTLKQRNVLWRQYRNFLRQGISNYRASFTVDNRSASLLHYYAMLNMAKAELLKVSPATVRGFVAHGLSFNVTSARTVTGDSLTVREGVFKQLYEYRTGSALPVGTRLPIIRLLRQIPEIGLQLSTIEGGGLGVHGALHLLASDTDSAWTLLAIESGSDLTPSTITGRRFARHFRPIDHPPDWRDRFAVSRRWSAMDFFESTAKFTFRPGDDVDQGRAADQALQNTWQVGELLALTTMGMWDAWLTASMYRTKFMPMPPALARYAIAFYASSLVRYRPEMFDQQLFPEQAFLFDAIARECAVPMLVDTISALTGKDLLFISDDALRL